MLTCKFNYIWLFQEISVWFRMNCGVLIFTFWWHQFWVIRYLCNEIPFAITYRCKCVLMSRYLEIFLSFLYPWNLLSLISFWQWNIFIFEWTLLHCISAATLYLSQKQIYFCRVIYLLQSRPMDYTSRMLFAITTSATSVSF